MKKTRPSGLVIALLAAVLLLSNTCMASSAVPYKTYVDNQMVPKYKKAEKGTKTFTRSASAPGGAVGSWCRTKGILSVYTEDLNSDRTEDALVVYLKKENPYLGVSCRSLHLAALTVKNGKITVSHDVTVNKAIDDGMKTDIRIYVKTYKKKKYVVIQDFFGTDGCGCSTYVLQMTSNGKLAVKKALFDPGSTSGISLYRLPLSGPTDRLTSAGYLNKGKTLYSTDLTADPTEKPAYRRCLKKELRIYGLKIQADKTYFGAKEWMIGMGTNMRLICSLRAKCRNTGGKFRYTYVLTDRTKFS